MDDDNSSIDNFLLKVMDETFNITDEAWLHYIQSLEQVNSKADTTILLTSLIRFVYNTLSLAENQFGESTKEKFREALIEYLQVSCKYYPTDSEKDSENP